MSNRRAGSSKGNDDDIDHDFFDSPSEPKASSSKSKDITGGNNVIKMPEGCSVPVVTRESQDYSDSFESDEGDDNDGRKAPSPRQSKDRRRGSNNSDRSRSVSHSDESGNEDDSRSKGRSKTSKNAENEDSGSARPKSGHPRRNQRRRQSRSRSRSRSRSPESKDNRRRSRSRSRSGSEHSDDSVSDTETESSRSGSDSEMTDVSPLTSPATTPKGNSSRKKKVEIGNTYTYMLGRPPKSPASRSRPTSGKNNSAFERLLEPNSDSMNLKLLMQAVMEMESERETGGRPSSGKKQFTVPRPSSGNRKNLSFRNDQVRDIDRENQRLMHQILKQASLVKSKKTANSKKKKVPTATLR